MEGRGEARQLTGSHLSSLILTELPSPLRQTIPFITTSLALRMFFYAQELAFESFPSRIEQFGKNLALKTLQHKESGLFIIRHTCFSQQSFIGLQSPGNLCSILLGFTQSFPLHPGNLPKITVVAPPKLANHDFNILNQPLGEFEATHGIKYFLNILTKNTHSACLRKYFLLPPL